MELRRFQRRFLRHALAPGCDTAVLSGPRGLGKTTLAGYIAARAMTPGDPLHVPGGEIVIVAASIEQGRLTYRACRDALANPRAYRFTDAANRIGIVHKASATRLRVAGSNAKGAFGLVGVPLVVGDEPAAWETLAGQMMADAIMTAQGKPLSPLRFIAIGTLAPGGLPGTWWHDLVMDGSGGSRYVQLLQGDPERWDKWPVIRKANPLTAISADFRRKLLEERDAARRDSRLKARFLSYRLNIPTGDESTVLLTTEDWRAVLARPVPARDGRPIVGVDLGAGRAWSAAVAVWRSGRVEAIAIAPGIPDLETQEKRDRVPWGTYRKLALSGSLRVADGLRVATARRACARHTGRVGRS